METHQELIQILFGGLAKKLATCKAEELQVKNGLLTKKELYIQQHVDQLLQKICESWNEAEHMLCQALTLLEEKISLSSTAQEEWKQLHDKITKLFSEGLQIPEDATFASLLGISPHTLSWIYQVGFDAHKNTHRVEAESIFLLLTYLNPFIVEYWIALGITQKDQNKQDKAISSFAIASLIHPNHVSPHYHLATLFLQQQKIEQATEEVAILEQLIATQQRPDLQTLVHELQTKIAT